MASIAQITANQQNAQQSTGPRTAPGKAASSRNAYRNGCYSAKLKFDSPEQEAAFNARLTEFRNVYQPDNEVEEICVQQIARAAWLTEFRDAEESEYEVYLKARFAAEPDPQDPAKPASIRFIEARATDKTLRALARRGTELRQLANRNLKELRRLQALRERDECETMFAQPNIPAVSTVNLTKAEASIIWKAGFDPFEIDLLSKEERDELLLAISMDDNLPETGAESDRS